MKSTLISYNKVLPVYVVCMFQAENKSLHEREQKLKERERMVSISSQNIQTIAQHEIKQKLQVVEEVS